MVDPLTMENYYISSCSRIFMQYALKIKHKKCINSAKIAQSYNLQTKAKINNLDTIVFMLNYRTIYSLLI